MSGRFPEVQSQFWGAFCKAEEMVFVRVWVCKDLYS